MASITLGAVGNIFGPIGGFIGQTIGTYIDDTLIYPALFGEDTEGPRINNLALSYNAEGTPISFCLGPECGDLPGQVLWIGPLQEVKIEEDGKGGGPTQTSYEYFVDIAVMWCETSGGNAISKVVTIWADGVRFYDDDPSVAISSSSSSVLVNATAFPQIARYKFDRSLDPDIEKVRAGRDITFAGFTNAANNGTFRVQQVRTVGDDVAVRVYNENFVNETKSGISANQTNEKFSPAEVEAIDHHLGTFTQNPDTTLEAQLGVGNVPGYRGRAYTVFKKVALAPFGNRPPQSFKAVVEANAGAYSLQSGIGALLERAGFDAAQYDTTGVPSSIELRGYTIKGPQPTAQALQPLMLFYDVLGQETDNKLKFFTRDTAAVVTVPESDLSAVEFGQDKFRPGSFSDASVRGEFSEMDVGFIDARADYTVGSARARARSFDRNNVGRMSAPLVARPDEAGAVAKRLLFSDRANRRTVKLSLPPKYINVAENDLLDVTIKSELYRVLVTSVTEGADFLIEVEAIIEEQSTLDVTADIDDWDGGFGEDQLYVPPEIELEVVDLRAFRSSDVSSPGIYLAASRTDGSQTWAGGEIWQSIDGGTSFSALRRIDSEATMGRATTVLATHSSLGVVTNSTVRVELYRGTLSSVTRDQMLAGRNLALIGNEIVAFQNATLVDTLTYDIDTMPRGLFDTEDAMTGHAIGDRFVLLDANAMFQEVSLASVGQQRIFRAVPNGGAVADYRDHSDVLDILNVQPFRVAHVTSLLLGGDWFLGWFRRSRGLVNYWSPLGNKPLIETQEEYEVDILSGSGGTVHRTITSTASANGSSVNPATQTAVYDSADVVADFGSAQSSIWIRIYQIGARGRGRSDEMEVFG